MFVLTFQIGIDLQCNKNKVTDALFQKPFLTVQVINVVI